MNAIYSDDTVCILSALHPARCHVPACSTDIARTFSDYANDYQSEQIESAQSEQHQNYLRGES